jgi:chromosome segregation protein
VETNAGIDNLAESIRRLTAEKPLLTAEVASIEQQLAEAAVRATQSVDSLTRLEADSHAREARVHEHQQRLEQLQADRVGAAESLTEARVAAGKLIEKRTSVAQLIGALRRGIRETQQALAAAEHEMAECTARIAESTESITQCEKRLADLITQAQEIEAEGTNLRAEREALRRRQEELAAAIRGHRESLAAVEQQLHEHQLALHEAGIRRDELVDRVRTELDIELAVLYPTYEHSDQDWQAIETEIADLRQKIHRLGNINLDAIGEQEELEERHAFLTSQRDDLDAARAQLDTLIEELNGECRERFAQAFEAIRENFRDLFRKLFGGGKADMILENPDDVLESGIEILARPPGKELQSISLLSGGEKSLTAIALLMSIFRSRPSPFAILDEVDAALDESNNERFNGIIREFLDKSQFIVISHSKRTMSIADQMYGVTMQEPGVSTRVSVRFDDVGRAGRSAVA